MKHLFISLALLAYSAAYIQATEFEGMIFKDKKIHTVEEFAGETIVVETFCKG